MNHPAYPKYRSSGVDWIPELPDSWGLIALRWISRLYSGGTPDKTNSAFWDDGDIPWLNSGAVNAGYITEPSDYISRSGLLGSSAKWIPTGSLVIALAGQGKTKGMVAQLGFKATCNQSMAAIIPEQLMRPRYLYWWLVANYQNIRNMAGGEARDGLSLDLLGGIPCPIPDRDAQRAIADFLDRQTARIDAVVAKKRTLLERLKEKRAALISRTVTRGLPPAAARAAGLDPNPKLKPSGIDWLGEVPDHWKVATVRRHRLRIQAGSTPPTTEAQYYEDGDVPWFGPGSFDAPLDVGAPVKLISAQACRDGVARIFRRGATLIVSIGATLGKVAYLPQSGSCNQQVTAIEFSPESVHARFATYQLRHLEPCIRGIAPSATLPILDQGEVADLPPMPLTWHTRLAIGLDARPAADEACACA